MDILFKQTQPKVHEPNISISWSLSEIWILTPELLITYGMFHVHFMMLVRDGNIYWLSNVLLTSNI